MQDKITIADAPDCLNTNDKAMWVLGYQAALAARSTCLHQIQEPAPAQAAPAVAEKPDEAQIKALMRKHRIWIEHSTLFEDDEPPRELRAVQAEQHQFESFVRELLALAATPAADAPDLHAQIMNLPLGTFGTGIGDIGIAYRAGHRAARHAAAELATFHATQLATFSAAAPVVLPEPVGWRHSLTLTLHETEEEVQLADGDSHAQPLFTEQQVRALLAGVSAPAALAVERGEVLVTVSGFTGSGKSAIAGEIEIMCRALGLQVEWPDSDSEKHMTHADWIAALEQYKPRVRIVECNVPHSVVKGQDK